MRHGAKNVSPALLPPLHFFRAATWQSLPSNASRDLAPPRPRRLWPLLPDARLAAKRRMVHVVTRMPRWLKLQPQWVDHDYTLDTITPSASSVARHTHITQPCRARGDGPATLPRRTLTLSFTKRRRDALPEPRILLCFRSGAAGDQLRDSCFHERSVAAELSQKRRAHAFDVRYAYARAPRPSRILAAGIQPPGCAWVL